MLRNIHIAKESVINTIELVVLRLFPLPDARLSLRTDWLWAILVLVFKNYYKAAELLKGFPSIHY